MGISLNIPQNILKASPGAAIFERDQLFDETVNENIGIMANNKENHDMVGAPVNNVADIDQVAAVEIIAAAVETITDIREHEYEWSSDITQINHQLQSINQEKSLQRRSPTTFEFYYCTLTGVFPLFILTMFAHLCIFLIISRHESVILSNCRYEVSSVVP